MRCSGLCAAVPTVDARQGARRQTVGAWAAGGCDGFSGRHDLGLEHRRRGREGSQGAEPQSGRSPPQAYAGTCQTADQHAAPSLAASGRLRLTLDRLDELVPVEPAAMENRQVIEWDKDDIDALKFMKVDVLGLGMRGCMRRAFDLLDKAKGMRLDLATIPAEDPATYAMIRKADTVGTFQIESRAQMAMLPRLKPKMFYDLVIEVAIVRPGPIQGDMVHPYIRRREGKEPVDFPTPALEKVWQDARRAVVSGTGDAGRHGRRRLLSDGSRPAPSRHGDVQIHRWRQRIPGQADHRHAG
jgi:hypothetical protein